MNNSNCPTALVDPHGHSLETVTGVKHDGTRRLPGTRRLHDLLVKLLSNLLRRAKIPHMGGVGGFKRTRQGLFTEFLNQLPELDPDNPAHAAALRYRQGVIPGLMLDTESIDLLGNVAKAHGGRALADMRALAPGIAYSESTSTTFSHSADKRQKQASPAYHTAARYLDAELESFARASRVQA